MDYILIILAFLIATAAQMYLSASYQRYLRVSSSKNKTGFEVARAILDKHGCIPESVSYPVEYQAILYFFKQYKDNNYDYDPRIHGLCEGFDQFYKIITEKTA